MPKNSDFDEVRRLMIEINTSHLNDFKKRLASMSGAALLEIEKKILYYTAELERWQNHPGW